VYVEALNVSNAPWIAANDQRHKIVTATNANAYIFLFSSSYFIVRFIQQAQITSTASFAMRFTLIVLPGYAAAEQLNTTL
jgi:hypothetical protein